MTLLKVCRLNVRQTECSSRLSSRLMQADCWFDSRFRSPRCKIRFQETVIITSTFLVTGSRSEKNERPSNFVRDGAQTCSYISRWCGKPKLNHKWIILFRILYTIYIDITSFTLCIRYLNCAWYIVKITIKVRKYSRRLHRFCLSEVIVN